MNIQINDIVGRVSYKCDVLFRVIDIRDIDGRREAILYGEDIRLIADAPFQDLMIINDNERNDRQRSNEVLQEQSDRLLTQDLELQQQKTAINPVMAIGIAVNIFKYQGGCSMLMGMHLT